MMWSCGRERGFESDLLEVLNDITPIPTTPSRKLLALGGLLPAQDRPFVKALPWSLARPASPTAVRASAPPPRGQGLPQHELLSLSLDVHLRPVTPTVLGRGAEGTGGGEGSLGVTKRPIR